MFTLSTDGIQALRDRIAEARAQVQPLVQESLKLAGEQMVADLSAAAPRGKSEGGTPPSGDADGPLADSFFVQAESPPSESGAAISVRTSQPTKLKFVVEGRGEVLPVAKKALYWQGLEHPVRRAGPAAPNDFVSLVVDAAPDAEAVLGPVFEKLAGILGG